MVKRRAFLAIVSAQRWNRPPQGLMSFLSMEMFKRILVNHFMVQLGGVPSSKRPVALNDH